MIETSRNCLYYKGYLDYTNIYHSQWPHITSSRRDANTTPQVLPAPSVAAGEILTAAGVVTGLADPRPGARVREAVVADATIPEPSLGPELMKRRGAVLPLFGIESRRSPKTMVLSGLFLVRAVVHEVDVDGLVAEGLDEDLLPDFKREAHEEVGVAHGAIADWVSLWWCDGTSAGVREEGELGLWC